MRLFFIICLFIGISAVAYFWHNSNGRNLEIIRLSTGNGDIQQPTVTLCLPNLSMFPEEFKNQLQFPLIYGSNEQHEETANYSLLLIAAYDFPLYAVVTFERVAWFRRTVYCRYLNRDWKDVYPPLQAVVYPKFTVHCCKQSNVSHMSITTRERGKIIEAVSVLPRGDGETKYNLSLCLAPMYGKESKWLLLTETIEHYKLQGVEHFYVYLKEVDNYTEKLMTSYVDSGDAEVIYLRSKMRESHLQFHGVQDCLQRSRYHSLYVIFADLDERIVPVMDTTLAAIIRQQMAQSPRIGVLRFTPRWILRTRPVPTLYEGEQTLQKHLPTLVFHNTSSTPDYGLSPKCAVDPKKVFWMWVHRARLLFPGYDMAFVLTNISYIRHYRDIAADDWGKIWKSGLDRLGAWEMTNYPDTVMTALYNRVRERLDAVYGECRR